MAPNIFGSSALNFLHVTHLEPRILRWIIQGDSKRGTQSKSKRRLNTRQTVGCGIPSSPLALRVDLRGLRSKLSWIRLTFSSDTRGRPEILPLHRQPICSNWWFQRQMLFHRWRLNVETKTKRTLHSSCRLSFNELTNAKNLVLHSSHFALNWRRCTAVRQASALAMVFET